MSRGIRTNEKSPAHANEHEGLPFCHFLMRSYSPFINIKTKLTIVLLILFLHQFIVSSLIEINVNQSIISGSEWAPILPLHTACLDCQQHHHQHPHGYDEHRHHQHFALRKGAVGPGCMLGKLVPHSSLNYCLLLFILFVCCLQCHENENVTFPLGSWEWMPKKPEPSGNVP